MHISIDWIKDFVDLPEIPAQELGIKFTLATCEVEDVEIKKALPESVVAAEITSVDPHPNADKLRLVGFNTGSASGTVVCGAPNVAVGMKVPYAPVGTTLPIGFTLEPKEIRGVLSEGMLCAEDELGLGSGHEGLLELPEDVKLGQTISDYMGLKEDILLEIDNKSITHRPDLWGHYGMAREFSAVFGNPLRQAFDEKWRRRMEEHFNGELSPIRPEVSPDSACLRFCTLAVDGLTVKDSPVWMQQRLNACGMRPINNIVDISNYVMLELGIPNHIFDRSMISGGRLVIRTAGSEQMFTTLDGQERAMIPTDTLVCDAEKPLAIAGIMGGLESGISANTSSILIEAANWKDSAIRRTSTRLGLRTDASQRYEKSLDSHLLDIAALRILELVLESCPEAKVAGKLETDKKTDDTPLVIATSAAEICSVLGKQIETDKIIAILESLEFKVADGGDQLSVTVPTYRATKDIECEADIVEEIGRIIGFDNITPAPPSNEISAVRLSEAKTMDRKIRDYLVYRGQAHEAFTYPLVGETLLEQAEWDKMNAELELRNALNPEQSRMRPSLIPGLIQSAAQNQKQFASYRMFELGRSYLSFEEEREQLGIVAFDRDANPFVALRDIVEGLMKTLNLPVRYLAGGSGKKKNPLFPENWNGIHPHEYIDLQIMGKTCGFINTVHPVICRKFKIRGYLVIAVIDTTDFRDRIQKDKTKYRALPKFPASQFDCTVVTAPQTQVEDVLAPLRKLKLPILESVKIADVYTLDENQKTVTVRSTFLDREKTMDGETIRNAENSVVETLKKAGFPLKM